MYDKICNDYYKTKLPYARKKENPSVYDEYKADQNRLDEEFKRDALAHVGLTGHPKADKAYAFAWQEGHAGGCSDVLHYLDEVAQIILD